MKLKIRKLTVADALNVATIIDEIFNGMNAAEIEDMIKAKDSTNIGMKMIREALKQSNKSILNFLAAVNEMSTDEFLQLDAEAIPETVSAILEDPRNSGFFKHLRGMLPSK